MLNVTLPTVLFVSYCTVYTSPYFVTSVSTADKSDSVPK